MSTPVFTRPECLKDAPFRYCPGCGHGIAHRLIAQCIDRLGVRERTIGIAPVGCAVFAYDYFDFDMLDVAHGRPPAAATGIKRMQPDKVVFSYQGDGDLAAIGMAEIVHAAARGENISFFFINNATYGMTGGQMAPTTLQGQVTTTTPKGRASGYPIRVAEMLSTLEGATYIERVSLDSAQNIKTAYRAVEKAFRYQLQGKGFTLVEMLSPCPTDWWMSPAESVKWLRGNMIPAFPLGVFKDSASS